MIEDCFRAVGAASSKWPAYYPVYERLLAKYVGTAATLVEVGVGAGGSLAAWREFLGPAARIIGIDIHQAAQAVRVRGLEIFVGDQADPSFWRTFFAQVGSVDVLIDDGGHKGLEQIVTVAESLPNVNDGGIVVVEDTHTSYMPSRFGTPAAHDFMNYAKHLADVVNSRGPEVARPARDSRRLATLIYGIEFYESLVVFHIDRRLARPPSLDFLADPPADGTEAAPSLAVRVLERTKWLYVRLREPSRVGRRLRKMLRDFRNRRKYFD